MMKKNRIYIIPTRLGVMFLIILSAMLSGSANYNNNLGFLLTFLLGSMAFVSIVHTYRNLAHIGIVPAGARPVFAGKTAVFNFLASVKGRSRPTITFGLPKGPETVFDLFPDLENRVSVETDAGKRGILKHEVLVMTTMYPLGLFRARTRMNQDLECVVYPKPVSCPFEPAKGVSYDTDEKGESRGPGVDDFMGLRSYREGDSLQHISWKAFSRGQGLHTKDFAGTAGSSSVSLDWNIIKGDTELKLSYLCDMVLKAFDRNIVFSLDLPGLSIGPDKGEAHRNRCLKALAMFRLPDRQKT